MKEKKIVFVCTGNTCRSPMAEAIFNELTPFPNLRAVSCGVSAAEGAPASEAAIKAVQRYGARLEEHRSKRICQDLLQNADAVFCMTSAHVRAFKNMFPDYSGQVTALAEIPDPYGGSFELYEETAEMIYTAVMHILDKMTGYEIWR